MADPTAAGNNLAQLLGALKIDPQAWEKLDPMSSSAQEANAAQQRARYERACIIARGVSDDALAVIEEQTIAQETFPVASLGLFNAVGFGIMREGQNQLARWIRQQKAIAAAGPAGDAAPKAGKSRR